MTVGAVFRPESEEHEGQVLAQLADGSLPDRDRQLVEKYVASSPAARERLERQRRVIAALRSGGPEMPDSLRASLMPGAAGRARVWRSRSIVPRSVIAIGMAAAVVALIVVVAATQSGSGTPSISEAAQLALKSPTHVAPSADPRDRSLLQARFAGITFPDYRKFRVSASGERADRLGDRDVRTVYYRLGDGASMSYSVVDGLPLPLPDSARLVVFEGVEMHTFRDRSLQVVTLVRRGRTCVLAAKTSARRLELLAAAPVRAARAA
jgi:anti-sigma factor RsiW